MVENGSKIKEKAPVNLSRSIHQSSQAHNKANKSEDKIPKKQDDQNNKRSNSVSSRIFQLRQAGTLKDSPTTNPSELASADNNTSIDPSYFKQLTRELQIKRQRVSAFLKTLGVDPSTYKHTNSKKFTISDQKKYDSEAASGAYPSNEDGNEYDEVLEYNITDKYRYPAIPPIDKIYRRSRMYKSNGEPPEIPVMIPAKDDVLLKRELDISLLSEATLLIKQDEEEKQSKKSQGLKGNDGQIFSPRVLVKIAYLEAVKRSIDGDSFVTKGGLKNVSNTPLCFSLCGRYLENHINELSLYKNHLLKYRDSLKSNIDFETRLAKEVNDIGNMAMTETKKAENITLQIEDNNLSNDKQHHPYHAEILTKLAKRRRTVQEEVAGLMDSLKYLIEDHLAPYISEHTHEIMRSSAYFVKAGRSNSSTLEAGKNRDSAAATSATPSVATRATSTNSYDEKMSRPTSKDSGEISEVLTSAAAANISALKNSKKYAIPKELQITTDEKDPAQISIKLQSIILFLLNQLLESTEEEPLYLQVPTLDDHVIKFLVHCQVATQDSQDPYLISLRDFGKPVGPSTKFRIKIP